MTSQSLYEPVMTKVDGDSTDGNVEVEVRKTANPTIEGGDKYHKGTDECHKETDETCCKCLHKPGWLLFVLCSVAFIQGAVTDGLVNTSVTSIERRFNLTSKQSGIIVGMFFFSGVFVTLFVAYLGGRGHKARWVASGMVVYAIGSFLFALPHFMSGYYSYDSSDTYSYLCASSDGGYGNDTTTTADVEVAGLDEGFTGYLYFFIVAQVFCGMGGAPLYCLGITYLDENVSMHRSGLFIGVFYAVATLGPAVGYIVGGVLLNTYTDIRVAADVTITPEDPGWVGAWWMGMVIASPLAIVSAAFMSLLPKELPGAEELRNQKISAAHRSSGYGVINTRPDFGERPSDFFVALALLFRNPTLMFLTAVSVFTSALTMGYSAYLPKILETLFGQTAAFAAAIVGAAVVIGGSSGSIIGGWLVKKYRWDIRENILFCVVMTVVSTLMLFTFLMYCPNQRIVEVLPSDGISDGSCLSACDCPTKQHHPVCASDGQAEYFSPCHAGCTQHFSENNTFGGCSCIQSSTTALDGPCEASGCPQLIVFTGGLFLCILTLFTTVAPCLHATLRCVPESQRPFSLGLVTVISKVLGSFPAPIIFGAIFDSACVVWQADEEGDGNGSCWIYDNGKLSRRLFMFSAILILATLVSYILSIYFYKPVAMDTSDSDKKEDIADVKRS